MGIPKDAVLEMLGSGKTLAEVGKHFGVSRQRIHQIARRAGVDDLRARRDAQRAAAAALRRTRAREARAERAAAARLATPEPKEYPRLSREALLDALRQWADTHHGQAPTMAEWRAAGWYPSVSLFLLRFDSWPEAVAEAGLTPPRARVRKVPRTSPEQILDAIEAFLRDEPYDDLDTRSIGQYERWRREHGAPSVSLVRLRFRSWGEARRQAMARIGQQ
jgi:uncharacterized protein (DUF433 family)